MAITRPLTAVAYALPLAVVVLARVWRERRWSALGAAMAAGAAVVAILPIWSRMTTGSWTRTPLALYTQQYMPWDRIGFGLDSTPPLRAGPPDMDQFAERYREWHREFTPAGAVRTALARAKRLGYEFWGGAAALTLFLALVGLKRMDRRLALPAAQAALLLLLYAFYAHGVPWNVYYLEALPVFSLMPVLGLYWLDNLAVAGGPPRASGLLPAGGFALVALMAGGAIEEYWKAGVRREPYLRLRRALAAMEQADKNWSRQYQQPQYAFDGWGRMLPQPGSSRFIVLETKDGSVLVDQSMIASVKITGESEALINIAAFGRWKQKLDWLTYDGVRQFRTVPVLKQRFELHVGHDVDVLAVSNAPRDRVFFPAELLEFPQR
jgi:hypothetical protein